MPSNYKEKMTKLFKENSNPMFAALAKPMHRISSKVKNKKRVDGFYERLSKIPEGLEIVEFLKDNKVQVSIDDQMRRGVGGVANTKVNKWGIEEYHISLSGSFLDAALVLILVHEARHIAQFKAGFRSFEDNHATPEEYCLLTRFREADAERSSVIIAGKLSEAGDTEPLRLKTSSRRFGSMYKAYIDNKDELDEVKLNRLIFINWFKSQKTIDYYDKKALKSKVFDFDVLIRIDPSVENEKHLKMMGEVSFTDKKQENYLDVALSDPDGAKFLTSRFSIDNSNFIQEYKDKLIKKRTPAKPVTSDIDL